MIDTIRFAIHDLYEHRSLKEIIRNIESGKDQRTDVVKEYTSDEMEDLNDKPTTLKHYYYQHSGKVITRNMKASVRSKSSEYGVQLQIEEHNDRILIELSVPKWIFGTNVIQFTPHHRNRDFNEFNMKEIHALSKDLYTNLTGFIEDLCLEIFYQTVELNYIEILRVDLCYNQVFNSQDDALEYLGYYRDVKKKWARYNNSGTNYQSGISYKTSRYYFKIYHKGAEFDANDKKKLREINKIKGKQGKKQYNIDALQDLANKTLRFEMEFKPVMMNYIFKRKVFRDQCEIWSDRKKGYSKIMNMRTRKMDQYLKLPQSKKKMFDYIDSFFNRKSYVMLHSKVMDKSYMNRVPVGSGKWDCLEDINTIGLSQRLLEEMTSSFLDIINQFEIKVKPTYKEFKDRLNELNKKRRRSKNIAKFDNREVKVHEMNNSRLFLMYNLLDGSNIKDIEERVIRDGILTKRTWQRWKKDLKDLGYTNTTVTGEISSVAKLDNQNYFDHVKFNSDKLFLDQSQFEQFEVVKLIGKKDWKPTWDSLL